jgi:hypothetical protein
LSRQPVGVDIEMAGAGAGTVEELRRWTALEAFVKGAGTGFGAAMPDGDYSTTANGFAFGGRRGEWFCTPAFTAAAIRFARWHRKL